MLPFKKFLQKTTPFVLDLLFPPLCLACRASLKKPKEQKNLLCEKCLYLLKISDGLFCPVCSRRLPPTPNLPARPSCHSASPFLLAAAASYENPAVKNLIRALKYDRLKTALAPLKKFLLEPYLKIIKASLKNLPNPILIPVPLHPKKERARGFNQALLIAKIVKELLGENSPPIAAENLVKTKNTAAQAEIKEAKKRAANIRGCFALKNPEALKNKNIILVDDVFTSGATAGEAAKILKAAGAKSVLVLVLAKT